MSLIIFIRTDSSRKIGSGHVMRCLTLAEELHKTDTTVEFITRNHLGNIDNQIKGEGFKVYSLPSPNRRKLQCALTKYEHWLGVKQNIDADETIQVLKGRKIDWLVIDHYAIDHNWESKLRPYVKKIMVIDDLANRKHDCDLLLDQNYIRNKNRYDHLVAPNTIRLLGLKYVLLKKYFIENTNSRTQINSIKRIFIFFGGADLDNLTTLAIRSLSRSGLKHLLVDVVIGLANPHQVELKKEIKKYPNIKLHIQIDNIAKIMSKADIGLGSGGSVTWERISIGLPSIVVTTANNQVAFIRELDKDGYVKWIGNAYQIDEDFFYNILSEVVRNPHWLILQAQKGQKLIDGMGVKRISNALIRSNENY
jgi:UDP-2,4-diacetamido-2,4,6-trideoxy-beta-L-altropyranose hydrolase